MTLEIKKENHATVYCLLCDSVTEPAWRMKTMEMHWVMKQCAGSPRPIQAQRVCQTFEPQLCPPSPYAAVLNQKHMMYLGSVWHSCRVFGKTWQLTYSGQRHARCDGYDIGTRWALRSPHP